MSEELTLQELKFYLWESANILRGSIDAADFKNYILGMLFFKRLSDVYDEEYAGNSYIRESRADRGRYHVTIGFVHTCYFCGHSEYFYF